MSDLLYLFFDDTLDIEQAFSIVISKNQQVLEPLEQRQPVDVYSLSQSNSLIVVLPCTMVTAHLVTLPTLNKAENMIANILEEQVLSDIDTMHFAFDKSIMLDDAYLVCAISKARLHTLLSQCNIYQLEPSVVISDLLFSQKNQLLLGKNHSQLCNAKGLGGLSADLLKTTYSYEHYQAEKILAFSDTCSDLRTLSITEIEAQDIPFQQYIACQLSQQPNLNLLQGAFKAKPKKNLLKKIAAPCFGLAVIFFVTANIFQYYQVNSQLQRLKKQNFTLYKKAFPEATTMISPKFRIEQLLQQNKNDQDSIFFSLMQKVAPLLNHQHSLVLSMLNMQNDQLTLSFQVANFQDLEKLQQAFERNDLKINQLSATTKKSRVNVVWRVQ